MDLSLFRETQLGSGDEDLFLLLKTMRKHTDITLPLVLSAVSFITSQSVVSNTELCLTWGQRSLDHH